MYKNWTWNPQGEKENTESAHTFIAEKNSTSGDHRDQNTAPIYYNPTLTFKSYSYTAHLKNGQTNKQTNPD